MSKMHQNGQDAGFTLLEMLVVLAITAILFGISSIGISVLRGRTSPDALVTQVARLLNDVRARAVSRLQQQAALIDMKTKTVSSAFDDPPVTVPASFHLKVTIGRETVTDTERLQIYFLPDGTSSGVEIDISSPDGQSASLETNWLTGLTRQVHAEK